MCVDARLTANIGNVLFSIGSEKVVPAVCACHVAVTCAQMSFLQGVVVLTGEGVKGTVVFKQEVRVG